ncbi:unnamed protein product [Rangifer tarandus platyrhynchus]|uniref:Uncharacterized protein n=1 Tax=Rangifer tarandus platyrhynchus TaxID=3082113 RepID=A0AC59YWT9_RANTA
MGEVWFLTQGSAGQGGRTGGQLHFHQHLFTELSPRARLTEQAGRNSNGADVSPILEMLGACVSVRIIRRGHSTRNQPVQLTTATVMNKEGLRNSQRPKEIRETGGLNAIWRLGATAKERQQDVRVCDPSSCHVAVEIPSFPPGPRLTSYLRLPLRRPREILGGPASSGGQGNPSASLSTSRATSPNSSQEEDCSGSGLVSAVGPRPVGEGAGEAGQPVRRFPDSAHPSQLPPATRPLPPPPCPLTPFIVRVPLVGSPVSTSQTSKSDGQSREGVHSTPIQTLQGRTLNSCYGGVQPPASRMALLI